MTHRTTVTLQDDAFIFLNQAGSENKSAFVNQLLLDEQKRSLKKAILKANLEEAGDLAYQAELGEWDKTLTDGLEP
jgi:hypothetical protein